MRALFVGILGILMLVLDAGVAAGVEITFLAPAAGTPLFGEVEFVVEVLPVEEVEKVEFYVDDELVGVVNSVPYSLVVDVGEQNREHEIRVRVSDSSGGTTERGMVSPPIRIDDRIDAELQQLYVTVLRDGERVLDLERQEITILDQGDEQETVTFSRGDLPLASVVLVDASSSMKGRRLRFALGAAADFARSARIDDEISIQLFSDRLLYASPFSNDVATLTAGLANVEADGGTALNDHLYRSIKLLEARQGRRVVIFLSDGIDSHSVLRMPQVSWLARRGRAMIYWIRVDPSDMTESRYSAWKDPDQYRSEYRRLQETVAETGGRVVTLERIEDAEQAVREILTELREQYALGYYPSVRRGDGSWHKVNLKVRRADVSVRARGGYIDY
ncbi:MAG: VWA domain-containing protein [bacterium]|nr:VWA domain-containing protein [bacterium]